MGLHCDVVRCERRRTRTGTLHSFPMSTSRGCFRISYTEDRKMYRHHHDILVLNTTEPHHGLGNLILTYAHSDGHATAEETEDHSDHHF